MLAVVAHIASSTMFYVLDWFTDQMTLVVVRPPIGGSLPLVHEGDGILLRNFIVRRRHDTLYLVNCDVSAWCIFTDGDGDCSSDSLVEYGEPERTEIESMRNWWNSR
jgi:hypothetical protein